MKRARQTRGETLLEAMAVIMVLALGILGVTFMIVQATRQNRRTLSAAQAQAIAEWRLEQIEGEGCSRVVIYAGNPCHNLKRLDNTVAQVWWSSNGPVLQAPPALGPDDAQARPYTLAIDVDGRGTDPVSGNTLFEGAEQGSPVLDFYNGTAMNLLNVRVTVSWDEPGFNTQAVVLQTRISP